ncbi:MAG: radical SAM protein [Candidatus Altiarchaeales archaeon WOR_SM1_79]|nr:MAG: radical SAM protein [Candidatus Altiarchaeales archaeon WOR_SM1_79]
MKILDVYGKEDLAKVYIARMRDDDGFLVEFVESTQPPIPLEKKWVLIVSSLFGCPVKCKMCDAGGKYSGKLETDEILGQIDYMVRRRFPDRKVPIPKFKIQFARMGEPSMNMNVLNALDKLPQIYDAPGLIPSVSTVAPKSSGDFLDRLIEIKDRHYPNGRFQLQFSIHSTNPIHRDELIPVKKWSFDEIAEYGARFHKEGDKKITLNFAGAMGYDVEPDIVRKHFDPDLFLIKLTPLNPTVRVKESELESMIDPYDSTSAKGIVDGFKQNGYDVILSIGEVEENKIGSNCGQFLTRYRTTQTRIKEGYDTQKYKLISN